MAAPLAKKQRVQDWMTNYRALIKQVRLNIVPDLIRLTEEYANVIAADVAVHSDVFKGSEHEGIDLADLTQFITELNTPISDQTLKEFLTDASFSALMDKIR